MFPQNRWHEPEHRLCQDHKQEAKRKMFQGTWYEHPGEDEVYTDGVAGETENSDLSLMELENKKADEDNFEDDGINDEEHNEDVDDNGDDKEDDGEDVDDKGEAIEDDGTSDEEHTEDGEGDGNASFVNLEEENESKRCCRH